MNQQTIDLLKRLGFKKSTDGDLTVHEFSFGNGYISGTSTAKDRIRVVEEDDELAIYAFEGWLVTWQLKVNVDGSFPFALLETILTKAVS